MSMKIKLSYKGIGEMLRGEEMKNLMADYGKRVAESAGVGYEFRTYNTGQRQAVNVFPATAAASSDNLSNNTLMKSLK